MADFDIFNLLAERFFETRGHCCKLFFSLLLGFFGFFVIQF